MSRLNLTLDPGTAKRLEKHARAARARRASFARTLLTEAMDRREDIARRAKLARDYAAGRTDARELLEDISEAQLEVLGREQD